MNTYQEHETTQKQTMAKFDIENDKEPDSLYISIDKTFEIRINRSAGGVVVQIYPYDGIEAVASTYAFDSDVGPDRKRKAVGHDEGSAV